jgi:hypothetical protein
VTTIRPHVDAAAVKSPRQATDANGKITVNHNTSVVRAADANGKITVNHNTSVVRVSKAR